jgi:hypothetical protein
MRKDLGEQTVGGRFLIRAQPEVTPAATMLGLVGDGRHGLVDGRPLGSRGNQRLGNSPYPDRRAAARPTPFGDRFDGNDLVGPHVLAIPEADELIGLDAHA